MISGCFRSIGYFLIPSSHQHCFPTSSSPRQRLIVHYTKVPSPVSTDSTNIYLCYFHVLLAWVKWAKCFLVIINSIFFLSFYYYFNYVGGVRMTAGTIGEQRHWTPGAWAIGKVVSQPVWVLGMELECSGRVIHGHNHKPPLPLLKLGYSYIIVQVGSSCELLLVFRLMLHSIMTWKLTLVRACKRMSLFCGRRMSAICWSGDWGRC